MPPRKKKDTKPKPMKAILWESADQLRGTLDAAEYKHFVLGLVFLKYVSVAMAEKRAQLEKELRDGSMLASLGLASILQWWECLDERLGSPRFVPATPGQGLRVSPRAAPGSTIPENALFLPPAARRGQDRLI